MALSPRYVVVTPARNEEDYIEHTIRSVISQTVLPERYVIVSDGSTDRTDEIVQKYADAYGFITLVRAGERRGGGKNFGSKVRAFNAGYDHVRALGIDHELIGNLDADVSFEPDYFERLLGRFAADPGLGLAGGAVLEMLDGRPTERGAAFDSVCGAVQLFRRACFEEVGGYPQIDQGGEDSVVEIVARMKGWRVRHYPDLPVVANRPVMTGHDSVLGTRYNKGVINHLLGYHPIFQLAVIARAMTRRPMILGALWMLAGYVSAAIRKLPRKLPDDAVRYLRTEQLARLGLGRGRKA